MAKRKLPKLDGADARYGWEFGCDGFVSALEASKILGMSHSRMCDWLNDEDRKKPGHKAYPIRAGRPENYGRLTPWQVCVRSLTEHQKLKTPIEA